MQITYHSQLQKQAAVRSASGVRPFNSCCDHLQVNH